MAYRCGKLTGRDQSRVQRKALEYFQYMENRDRGDDVLEITKLLHHILLATDREVYKAAFPRPEADDPDVVPGHSYGVEDLPDLESVLMKLGKFSRRTQASLDKPEWTDWR